MPSPQQDYQQEENLNVSNPNPNKKLRLGILIGFLLIGIFYFLVLKGFFIEQRVPTEKKERQTVKIEGEEKENLIISDNTTWAKVFNEDSIDSISSLQQTRDSGYIVAGLSKEEANFLIIKLNSSGEQQWAKSFSGVYSDGDSSIQQTKDGGYIVGISQSSYYSASAREFLVIKLDSLGNKQWAKSYKSKGYISSLQQTQDGGYIIVGGSLYNADQQILGGDFRMAGVGSQGILVIKLNSSGEQQWAKILGGNGYYEASSALQTLEDDYIIYGRTYSYGGGLLVIKLNSSGEQQWAKIFSKTSSTGQEISFSIQQTKEGGYILSGNTDDDLFVIKLNSSGEQQWAKILSRDGYSRAGSIQQTLDGGYVMIGNTKLDTINKYNPSIIKLDSFGQQMWAKSFNEDIEGRFSSIQQTFDGGYIVAGNRELGLRENPLIIKLDKSGGIEKCSLLQPIIIKDSPTVFSSDSVIFPSSDISISDNNYAFSISPFEIFFSTICPVNLSSANVYFSEKIQGEASLHSPKVNAEINKEVWCGAPAVGSIMYTGEFKLLFKESELNLGGMLFVENTPHDGSLRIKKLNPNSDQDFIIVTQYNTCNLEKMKFYGYDFINQKLIQYKFKRKNGRIQDELYVGPEGDIEILPSKDFISKGYNYPPGEFKFTKWRFDSEENIFKEIDSWTNDEKQEIDTSNWKAYNICGIDIKIPPFIDYLIKDEDSSLCQYRTDDYKFRITIINKSDRPKKFSAYNEYKNSLDVNKLSDISQTDIISTSINGEKLYKNLYQDGQLAGIGYTGQIYQDIPGEGAYQVVTQNYNDLIYIGYRLFHHEDSEWNSYLDSRWHDYMEIFDEYMNIILQDNKIIQKISDINRIVEFMKDNGHPAF